MSERVSLGNCKHACKSENKEAIVKCINMFSILAEVKNKQVNIIHCGKASKKLLQTRDGEVRRVQQRSRSDDSNDGTCRLESIIKFSHKQAFFITE